MMQRIRLELPDGSYVATVEIVPFPDRPGQGEGSGLPDVVMWGTRFFVRWPTCTRNTYVEAFAHASLTPSPGLPTEERRRGRPAVT